MDKNIEMSKRNIFVRFIEFFTKNADEGVRISDNGREVLKRLSKGAVLHGISVGTMFELTLDIKKGPRFTCRTTTA